MDPTAFLRYLRSQPFYKGQIEHVERLRARRARYARLDVPLPAALNAALKAAGGNKSEAARLLKLKNSALYYKMDKYGL